MLQRLQQQKRAIVFASSDLSLPVNLTVSQWDLINLLIDTLNIFDQATLAVSSSSVSVSEIIPIVNSVISELGKPSESGSGIAIVRQSLLDEMNVRYKSIEDNEICSIATLLDPHLKGRVFRSPSALNSAKDQLVDLANQQECPASKNDEVRFLIFYSRFSDMWE